MYISYFYFSKIDCKSQSNFPCFVKNGGKMNIAFWSMSSGRSATSCNMLAVSIMSAVAYSVKGTLLQIDQFSRALDDVFCEKRPSNLLMEEYSYYSKKGLDKLVDKCQLAELSEEDLNDNIVPIKDTLMNYVPVSKRTSVGINYREYATFMKKMLEVLNLTPQLNFIDCINGDTPVARSILKEADVVVVNLSQGMNMTDLNIDREILKKAVYVVGKYDEESEENVSVIRQKFGIDRNDIAVIPYNIHFHDAVHGGKIVSFINKCMSARGDNEDLSFINNVFLAAKMVLRKAGYDEERK